MIALDTDVLICAHRLETDLHSKAKDRLTEIAERGEPCAIPVFCLTEFIRVTTHRRVFHPPSTLSQAIGFLKGILAAPTCHVALPGEGFFRLLESTLHRGDARGNLAFDAQIAALCQEHGIERLLTNDRDFERFGKLDIEWLDSSSTGRLR